jgi:hypothetical protein
VRTARRELELEGSVGLIVADPALSGYAAALTAAGLPHSILGESENPDARLVLVPATLAKGLEYDRVIVAEPAEIAAAEYSELLGLRRLYVVLTRAVSHLTVLHALPLPELLARG